MKQSFKNIFALLFHLSLEINAETCRRKVLRSPPCNIIKHHYSQQRELHRTLFTTLVSWIYWHMIVVFLNWHLFLVLFTSMIYHCKFFWTSTRQRSLACMPCQERRTKVPFTDTEPTFSSPLWIISFLEIFKKKQLKVGTFLSKSNSNWKKWTSIIKKGWRKHTWKLGKYMQSFHKSATRKCYPTAKWYRNWRTHRREKLNKLDD